MTKSEIIRSLPDGNKIDVAIPIDWAMEVQEQGVKTNWYVWDYRRGGGIGRPLDLAPVYIGMLEETVRQLTENNYLFLKKIKDLEENIRKQEVLP
jgi:hypothetical protein